MEKRTKEIVRKMMREKEGLPIVCQNINCQEQAVDSLDLDLKTKVSAKRRGEPDKPIVIKVWFCPNCYSELVTMKDWRKRG